MPEIVAGQSAEAIDRAVALLNDGGLVGLPTETVYGLAADADNVEAVAKIFTAKGRPADHPLIVHLGADDMLPHYAREIPDAAWALAEAFWPGPLTLILKKAPGVLDLVTGGQETIGLRIPGHPVALALLRAFAESRRQRGALGGGGIAAPSANRFGRISPTSAQDVAEELDDGVALILDGGDCQVGIESTIVDLSRGAPVILRPGAITAEQLSLVLGQSVLPQQKKEPETLTPRVSGTLASHYAPVTPLRVLDAAAIERALKAPGVAAIVRDCAEIGAAFRQHPAVRVLPNNSPAYAHAFYRVLRKLDQGGYRRILVQALPQDATWLAVQDRLGRAAHQHLPDNG